MVRPQLLGSLLVGLSLAGAALVWHSVADAGIEKSDSKVKATATATKLNAKGQQLVTVTLDIEKGWHLYANPVEHNNEFLENAQTKLTVSAKIKPVSVGVKYPRGKTKTDGKDTYNIYENRVTIQANVQRAEGDTGPLQISIAVNACNKNTCLPPGTVKLTVP